MIIMIDKEIRDAMNRLLEAKKNLKEILKELNPGELDMQFYVVKVL